MPLRVGLALTALLTLAACSDGAATQSGATLPPPGGDAQPDPGVQPDSGTPPLPDVDPIDLSGTGTVTLPTGEGIAGLRFVSASEIGDLAAAELRLTTEAGQITGIEITIDGVTVSDTSPFNVVTDGVQFQNDNNIVGIVRTGTGILDGVDAAPLEYMVYGTWIEPNLFADNRSAAFHTGNRTPISRMPTGERATYVGSANGYNIAPTVLAGIPFFDSRLYDATVTLSTENFDDFAFETSNSRLDTFPVDGLDLTGTLSRSGNGLSGTVSGKTQPYTGTINARFYGPEADEIGGVFSFEDSNSSTIAGFGASRDP